MPPVFGIWNIKSKPPDPVIIRHLLSSAHYMVPRQITTLEKTTGWIAAAMRKDTAKTAEPTAVLESGNYIIAADASLYNRTRLLTRLGMDRQKIAPTDTELILEAYKKWDNACPKYLYGDFAFAIMNTQSGEIFCGRDPLGVRTFFYNLQEDRFIFSSELRIVAGAFDKKPGLDKEYLLESLVGVKSSKDRSPFENIFRLPPAHYLVFKKGEIRIERYWLPDVGTTITLNREEDYIDMFRELLANAVNMRCKGVLSLGSELSGGLDSAAVTGIAMDSAATDKIPFAAFSNVFPEGTGIECKDEREFIREMLDYKAAGGVNIEGVGIPVTDLLRYTLNIQGVFVQQNFNMFNYGLYKAAGEKGIGVLLSGFGGDELVSARVSLPWNELIGEKQWPVIRDELFYRGVTPKSLLKPGLIAARYLYSRIHKPQSRMGVFTPELLEKRLSNLPLNPSFVEKHQLAKRFRDRYKLPYREKLSARQLVRISMEHLPQRMEYCYTAAAQFGIEYRYPLLDVNLVLACLAFPPWIKQHHGTNRYLFRQAIAGYVPEAIRKRNDKSGSTIPHIYFSLIRDKELILDLVRSCAGSPVLQEIFDFSRFPAWHEKLVKRDAHDINHLMPGAFYNYLMIMMYFKSDA